MKRPTEAQEQETLAEYLDLLTLTQGVLWCHVPNEGVARRVASYVAALVRQGLKPGVPDVLIFTAPPRHPAARGVAIELKRVGTGAVSDNQRQWLADLEREGWLCRVCYGFPQAHRWLQGLGWP